MAKTESESVETLSDFLEWASQFNDGTYVFRGVPNAEYGIQASAYQNGKNKNDKSNANESILDEM